MEKDEILGTLKGGIGLAGKLMGKSVDEVSKALKSKDDGSETMDTGLYYIPGDGARFGLATTIYFQELQTQARTGAAALLKTLTTPGAEKLFAQACALLLQGDTEGSMARLREAIAKDSQTTDAYFLLGSVLLDCDRPSEAIKQFNTALLCQQRLGKGLKKALPTFGVRVWLTRRSAFCLYPDLVGLNLLLSLSQRKAGKLDDAIHTLEQLLKVAPAEPVALFFLGLYRLEEGQPRETYELLREFLPDNNLNVANLLLLGHSCSALGDPVTSRELYKKALQKSDLDPTLRLDLRQALGEALVREGWASDGKAEFEAVATADPDYVPLVERMGAVKARAPKPAEPDKKKPTTELAAAAAPPEPPRPPEPVDGNPVQVTRLVSADNSIDLLLGDDPVSIGREEGTIALRHDTAASRAHARIVREGDAYFVEDLGSTNGTWVNRHRIGRRVELNVGDVIQIGETRFRVL